MREIKYFLGHNIEFDGIIIADLTFDLGALSF
jgi:hypothetical protein